MPDLSAILALSTILSFGHGCPVSAGLALTARHVVDPRPLNADSPLLPVQWSARGLSGTAVPTIPWADRDIAVLRGTFTVPFVVAATMPAPGTFVYFAGFDWDSVRNAMAEKVIKAKVLRVVGGQLIYDKSGLGGSSGSCVLNGVGEVVAINIATLEVGRDSAIGIGVGVWGLDVAALEASLTPEKLACDPACDPRVDWVGHRHQSTGEVRQ